MNCSSRGMGLKSIIYKSPGWQPYLADWRSQDLGSKGQSNLGDYYFITMEITSPSHSYDEIEMPVSDV